MLSMDLAPLSVRELIASLAQVEESLRTLRLANAAESPDAAGTTEVRLLVHREQAIVHELDRRARVRRTRDRHAGVAPPWCETPVGVGLRVCRDGPRV